MHYLQVDRDYVDRIGLPVSDEAIAVGHVGQLYTLLRIHGIKPTDPKKALPDIGNSLVEKIKKTYLGAITTDNALPNLGNSLEE